MACIYIEDFCSFFMLIIFLAVFKDRFLYYIPKIYKIVLKMGVQFFTFIKMYSICQFKSEDAFYVYWQVNLDCLSDLTVLFWFVVVAQSLMSDSLLTPWTAALQASLSFTTSWNLLKLMSIELVMSSKHLILYCSLLLLPSIFPSIRVFSNSD